MSALIDAHAFVTALSAHSYGDLTLHPWGYTPTPAPDAPLLTRMAAIMCARNGYGHGSPASILYPASGGTIDWSYGQADGRPRVLAFANEIGDWGDGFWPPEDRRGELFAANLWPMRYLMMAAGPYVDADHGLASDLDGGLLEPGERGFFWFTVANRAARAAVTGTRITLACDDPYVQLRAASRKLGRLAPMAAVDLHADPFPIVVDAACPDGHVAQVSVTIDWGEGPLAGSLQFMVGRRDTILAD